MRGTSSLSQLLNTAYICGSAQTSLEAYLNRMLVIRRIKLVLREVEKRRNHLLHCVSELGIAFLRIFTLDNCCAFLANVGLCCAVWFNGPRRALLYSVSPHLAAQRALEIPCIFFSGFWPGRGTDYLADHCPFITLMSSLSISKLTNSNCLLET